MADKEAPGNRNASSPGDSPVNSDEASEERNEKGITNPPNSLEQFIVDNYEQQKSEGRHDATEDIDDDRTANFYSRAIAESRRMCEEVAKSKLKLDKLHAELSAERLAAWRTEHAAEVLLPEEAAKIAVADQIYS